MYIIILIPSVIDSWLILNKFYTLMTSKSRKSRDVTLENFHDNSNEVQVCNKSLDGVASVVNTKCKQSLSRYPEWKKNYMNLKM